jgi:hypothetical protein
MDDERERAEKEVRKAHWITSTLSREPAGAVTKNEPRGSSLCTISIFVRKASTSTVSLQHRAPSESAAQRRHKPVPNPFANLWERSRVIEIDSNLLIVRSCKEVDVTSQMVVSFTFELIITRPESFTDSIVPVIGFDDVSDLWMREILPSPRHLALKLSKTWKCKDSLRSMDQDRVERQCRPSELLRCMCCC